MSAVLAPADPPVQDATPLAGPKIFLLGESGTGKTYSLGTLADWCQSHEKEMFVLFTENSTETLLGYWRDRGQPIPPALHWHQAMTAPVPLSGLIQGAKDVGDFSYEALTKKVDPLRGQNNSFWKILSSCTDFPDDRSGKKFGAIDKWGIDRVFVIDSFTELSNACAKMVIGSKPTMAPPEYGVAQSNLMNFLRLVTQAIPCTVVMTGHPARDKDEISGTTKIQIATIGTAIQPQIPPLFSDVIYCVRETDKFYWSTAEYGVVAKTRSLGYRSKISPDFAQVMDLWNKRGGK